MICGRTVDYRENGGPHPNGEWRENYLMTQTEKYRLSRIRGIGTKRLQAITDHYGSIGELKDTPTESLISVLRINRYIAGRIKADLNFQLRSQDSVKRLPEQRIQV